MNLNNLTTCFSLHILLTCISRSVVEGFCAEVVATEDDVEAAVVALLPVATGLLLLGLGLDGGIVELDIASCTK